MSQQSTTTRRHTSQDGETTTTTTTSSTSGSGTLAGFLATYAVLSLIVFIGFVLSIVAWWKLSRYGHLLEDGHKGSYRTINVVTSILPFLGIFTSSPVIHWINKASAADSD